MALQSRVAGDPGAAAIGVPLPFPEGRLVFERLQQLLAAALGRAAAIGADGHQHDRLAREYPADAVLHQAAAHPMARAAVAGQVVQLALGHAGVVLQLQGHQGAASGGFGADAADEQALGGAAGAGAAEAALPLLQAAERFKGLAVQIDPQVHGPARFSHH